MIVPFLCFHGRCEEAVAFYAKVFNFEARFLYFHQVPQRGFEVPETYSNNVMFTQFTIADQQVMATDHIPGLSTQPGQSVTLNIIHPLKKRHRTLVRSVIGRRNRGHAVYKRRDGLLGMAH
jgi:PhnB protein